MKEAKFYIPGEKVRCVLCPRKCIIPEGRTGFCKVRKNVSGKLYSLVYSRVAAAGVDPIEKKPFYHFFPGSRTFSICTVGCNLSCEYCCNWNLSQKWTNFGEKMTPEEIVHKALELECHGVCYTYTEPTVFFEFAFDTARLARREGLYNCFVTNGYTEEAPVDKISRFLDAAVIDLKAEGRSEFYSKRCGVGDTGPIFRAIKKYASRGVHIEITDLVFPDTDPRSVEKLSEWIASEIGRDVPLHLIRYFPCYRSKEPSTEVRLLEKCRETAMKNLKYVYIGNVPGHEGENTYCECGNILIERFGTSVVSLKEKCERCGRRSPVKTFKTNRF
ncbi:MAG: AmmeMemoRadiSam system radical SAM enzyme [Candidatus Micrarchaeota archaeon]|nr:AmmeMemoRadiSam system radical SAM enzyme [Candidatus Micrarchaeota archaeon]